MERSVKNSIVQPASGFSLFVMGALAGVVGMYFLDPRGGNRRRAFLNDKATHMGRVLFQFMDKRSRDLKNRAYGTAIEARKSLRGTESVDDIVLMERIRSKMGRAASHPKLINIDVHDGQVTLTGLALKSELPRIYSTVRSVRGVKTVHNRLEGAQGERDISRASGVRGNEMASRHHASAPAGPVSPSI